MIELVTVLAVAVVLIGLTVLTVRITIDGVGKLIRSGPTGIKTPKEFQRSPATRPTTEQIR